jgi:uroporphyrinogen-III synthase
VPEPVRVLVTRPAAQAKEWVAELMRAGLDAVALPLIDIAAPQDPSAVRQAWIELPSHQLIFFVSPNAVEWFFSARPERMAWPPTLQVGSPGPGTSAVLRRCGVPIQLIVEPPATAPQFDSEALWDVLQRQRWAHASVLVVRGDGGRDWLAEQLRSAGAAVSFVSAYRRVLSQLSAPSVAVLQAALKAPEAHVWFFSSSEAVTNLLQSPQLQSSAVDWSQATALTTHPRIAASARTAGFGKVLSCRPALDAVVAQLAVM